MNLADRKMPLMQAGCERQSARGFFYRCRDPEYALSALNEHSLRVSKVSIIGIVGGECVDDYGLEMPEYAPVEVS